MRAISNQDIHDMNGIIMELPAFKELSSKEGLHNILDTTLKSIYIDTPAELMEYMRYNLNERLTETILENYGIDKNYSKKVNIAIKRILVFYIERLFQIKGSREVLGTFADIFGNFFENINFYNIVVDKAWKSTTFDASGKPTYENGEFTLNYTLTPIHIMDKENMLSEIDDDIPLSNKYLMTLDQYKDYTLFPINTNLVYIQFSGGIGTINNMKVFSDGIRAYGSTFLQKVTIEYPAVVKGKKTYIQIAGNHIEMLIKYFILKELELAGTPMNFQELGDKFFTNLTYDLEYLPTLEDVLHDYEKANYNNRSEMQAVSRLWQSILRHGIESEPDYKNFEELESLIKRNYGPLIDEFEQALDKPDGAVIDFYMNLYTETLRYFDLSNNYLQLYVNTIFMQVITGDVFIDTFFKPVFEIFVKYFFPVEMEYLNDFINKMIIKDKWNTVATEEIMQLMIQSHQFSLITPQRGLDKFRILFVNGPVKNNIIVKTNKPTIYLISKGYQDRIQYREVDLIMKFVSKKHTDINISDKKSIEIKRVYYKRNKTQDRYSIEIDQSLVDKMQKMDLNFKELFSIFNSSNKLLSKQMIEVNSKSFDNIQVEDSVEATPEYGDYNAPALIGDGLLNENKLNVILGLIDYNYRQSQVEQKYTYNKYFYYKLAAGTTSTI